MIIIQFVYVTTMAAASTDAYEMLALQMDPYYDAMLHGTELVKAFIIARRCIVYGGTAIDYALRLRGASIYDDSKLTIPDLDFYSTDSVGLAYDFAEQLVAAGHGDARAKTAIHSTTMKVDIGGNHWIADISYLPATVFDRIPTVEYMGMLCVHPDFQRIDLHSSLSYPYDNAPAEVIFARWKKDVARLGKIDAVYPIEASTGPALPKSRSRPRRGLPLAGWAAYSAIVSAVLREANAVIDGKHELAASFAAAENSITYASPACEYVIGAGNSIGAEYFDDACEPTHAGWASAMPARRVYEDGTITYDSTNQLLAVIHVPVGDEHITSVCVNGVLKYMMAAHYAYGCEFARRAYATLWRLCTEYGDKLSFLQLSVETYGRRNINSAQLDAMARVDSSRATDSVIPQGYRPARGKRPTFAYEGVLWSQDGRKL